MEKTIKVTTALGTEKEVTKVEFIDIWFQNAQMSTLMMAMPFSADDEVTGKALRQTAHIKEEIRVLAGTIFEEIFKANNK
jgi:hypothetical protein